MRALATGGLVAATGGQSPPGRCPSPLLRCSAALRAQWFPQLSWPALCELPGNRHFASFNVSVTGRRPFSPSVSTLCTRPLLLGPHHARPLRPFNVAVPNNASTLAETYPATRPSDSRFWPVLAQPAPIDCRAQARLVESDRRRIERPPSSTLLRTSSAPVTASSLPQQDASQHCATRESSQRHPEVVAETGLHGPFDRRALRG